MSTFMMKELYRRYGCDQGDEAPYQEAHEPNLAPARWLSRFGFSNRGRIFGSSLRPEIQCSTTMGTDVVGVSHTFIAVAAFG